MCFHPCVLRETLDFSVFSLLGEIKAKMPGEVCLLFEYLVLVRAVQAMQVIQGTQILSCKEKSTV